MCFQAAELLSSQRITHFMNIVVDVMTLRLPHVLKLCLG